MRMFGVLLLLSVSGCTASSYTRAHLEGTPFECHQESNGRVRFYLAPSPEGPHPLLLVIQGSGCESVFVSRANPDGSRSAAATAAQDIIQSIASQQFCVMIVEKPGVISEANSASETAPGSASGCSEEFRARHSLPAWTQRLSLAIDAALTSPHVNPAAGIRVLGLSEGAIAAARLAHDRTDISHIAFISGFGCDQWSDMLVVAARNALAAGSDIDAALSATQLGLQQVAADPLNHNATFEDQTYLYWSTFGRACPAQDLASSNADVFVAVGTADEQVDANGIEAICAARIAAGKQVTMKRIIGGSHILNTPTTKPFENLLNVFHEAVKWMSPRN